jgi:hypothetical protein
MITERDIKQAEKQETLKTDAYLKGTTDFVKWTSTLAAAAVLWVANGLGGQAGFSWVLSMTSLGILLAALAVAILAVHRVLTAWASEWSQSREQHAFYLLKQFKHFEPEQVSEEKEGEYIDRLLKATEAGRKYLDPQGFHRWVLWHVGLLLAGLFFYVIARGLG